MTGEGAKGLAMGTCVAKGSAPDPNRDCNGAVDPGRKALPPAVQRALAKVTEIGTLPEVTARVLRAIEEPSATPKTVRQAVQHDPALTTKILKLVNSAFYGLPAQVANLERAIIMLGLSAVRNLALAASLSRLFKNERICEQFTTADLWRHCVAVGVCSQALARKGRCVPGDEAFVAGLVHDMGLIVAQQTFREQVAAVTQRCVAEPQNYCAAEEAAYGADHQALGGALATKWKFPPGVCHAVAYHHDPSALQPDLQTMAALVYLADTLCCQGQHGFWLTAAAQELSERLMELTAVTAADLEQAAADLPARLAEAEKIFTVEG
jgi:HD-like signal output (HDOD) protein